MRSSLRLHALEAIDRVEQISTRKVGLTELRGILLTGITTNTAKDFINMLFDKRNKRLYVFLFPLVAETVLIFDSINLCSEFSSCLSKLVLNQSAHETVGDICADVFLKNYPIQFLLNVVKSPLSQPVQRKGVGICLLKMTSRSVMNAFETGNTLLSEHLSKLYRTDFWNDFQTEMFACVSMLIPIHENKFSSIIETLTIDCLSSLDSDSSANMPRQLALATCNLLAVIGQFFQRNSSVTAFSGRVLHLVSRDNRRLICAARGNPKLLEIIKLVRSVWESLRKIDIEESSARDITTSVTRSPSQKRILESLVAQTAESVFASCPDNEEELELEDEVCDSPIKGSESRFKEPKIDYSRCAEELSGIRVSGNDSDFGLFIETYEARIVWNQLESELCEWLFHVLVEMLGSAHVTAKILPTVLDWISISRIVRGIEETVSATDLINLFRYLEVLEETTPNLADKATEMLRYFYSP